jgi:hypothetical protein
MDVTRALMEAARATSTRFVTFERTWFGDGLQLIPEESCLGLASVNRMTAEWRNIPLLREQALRAAGHIASRFLRTNTKEWRAYNISASVADWPAAGKRRIIVLPGSRNEVLGHPDWDDDWTSKTEAFDALIAHLGLQLDEVVLRCHPNWAEKIGTRDGRLSEIHFTDWARRRGIVAIPASDSASTLALIEQCDAVVVGGSSAGLDAGILGKQVIAVSPSIYEKAGFEDRVYTAADLAKLKLHANLSAAQRDAEARRLMRQTLRFAYTMVYRIPQYVNYVRSVTTTRYEYVQGADPQRLISLFATGMLQPDDSRSAADSLEENEVVDLIAAREWRRILEDCDRPRDAAVFHIRRRPLFRPLDHVRKLLPHGDRWGKA